MSESMEEIHKAEVECLRRQLAEKDKEIQRLKDLLNIYNKNQWNEYDWIENKVKVTYDKEREDDNTKNQIR